MEGAMTNHVAGSTISLFLPRVTHEEADEIKSMLQWPNPDYEKKVRMGKSTWNTPKEIVLWQKFGDRLIVPFGMLQTLRFLCVNIEPESHLISPVRRFSGKIDNLYNYQTEALERALKARNGVLVAPCGSGKTQIGLAICAKLGYRTLWLTHTHELLKQSMNRSKQYLDCPMGTITEGKINASDGITFATVQTLSKIDLAPFYDFWDVIIVDECFPGDTMIMTPYGEKNLQSLHIGDIITSYNVANGKFEDKPIVDFFRLKAHDVVKVKLSNGEEIICTKNHPFYTKDGQWKNAGELEELDYVMRVLRKGNFEKRCFKNKLVQKSKERLGILYKGLFDKRRKIESCMDGGTQRESTSRNEENQCRISRPDYRTHEKQQSYVKYGSQRKNEEQVKRDWPSSKDQMWERMRLNCSTAEFDVGSCEQRHRSICRISNYNISKKRFWLSNLLQGRYRASRTSYSGRSGWQFSLFNRETRAGQEKGFVFEWVRVESVEVQKQTSDGTFGGLCGEGYVYNVEVADNNNYIANGVLVHNCHRAVGTPTRITMFWKVLSSLSARYKFGLTATPKRTDGMEKAMYALLGQKFYEISREDVKCSTVPLLPYGPLLTGWEPDYDSVLNPDGTLNYTSLITDCIKNDARNLIISECINIEAKCGPMLVLSERVEHLKILSSMCTHSWGNLSDCKKSERNTLLAGVASGEIQVLFATYAIAKEGIDIPCLRSLVMASPIKDNIAVTQSAGRVMRAYTGKEYGIVWDFEDEMPMLKRWLKKRMAIYKKLQE